MQDDDDLEELNEYGNELDEVLNEMRMGLKAAQKLNGEVKANKMRFVEDRLKRANELLEAYTLEIRARKGISEIYKKRREEYQQGEENQRIIRKISIIFFFLVFWFMNSNLMIFIGMRNIHHHSHKKNKKIININLYLFLYSTSSYHHFIIFIYIP